MEYGPRVHIQWGSIFNLIPAPPPRIAPGGHAPPPPLPPSLRHCNEDLNATVKVGLCKNEARNVARLVNKHGRVARQSGSGVVIDGIYYTHSALDNLPKEINIAATRTRYTNYHVGSTGHRAPCQTCTLPQSLLKATPLKALNRHTSTHLLTLLKHTRWHNRYGILVIHISPNI